MKPAAARVRRVGWRWQGEALVPNGGPWFVVSRHWTRWAAREALAAFLVLRARDHRERVSRVDVWKALR
jgi:hypothetical protein